MAIARTAAEQIEVMEQMILRAANLPMFERLGVAADLAAAQLTLNVMLLKEIEGLKCQLSERRPA